MTLKPKTKKAFLTEYKVGTQKYGADIMAYTLKEAERVAGERNIGETVIGNGAQSYDGYGRRISIEELNPDFKKLNDYEFLIELPRIIHSACFLSYIAFKSGKISIEELIGDNGILHELIHLLNGSHVTKREIRRTRGKYEHLQSITPGAF